MGDMVLKALLKYVESHPEVIEKLVEALIKKLIDEITHKDDKTS